MKTFLNPNQENRFSYPKSMNRPMPPPQSSRASFENVRLAGSNVGASMITHPGESTGSCSINIYINNDIQGINNSILIGGEVKMGDLGVSLGFEDVNMDRGFRLVTKRKERDSFALSDQMTAANTKLEILG
ncbi:hypothetical protein BUALT_Bualt02G0198600 [Buddleja alternifolia]|uniref:Uncharacterized protein n=1 Tax=Buddleja alternifolia TaxID=168488 RepID=A0AAV6Y2W2_9LAMI|nr:hypothetical protein BUALT_Bualt02G0198600 [Buddleja alternifolia]